MNKPKWILIRDNIKLEHLEELIFVGESGVRGVVDGKLPDGSIYLWTKRRGGRDRMKKTGKGEV